MNNAGSLNVSAHGDREIVMTRVFDAPRRLVFDAYTKPELLKRWLGVRGGWSLAVCELDLRVGGAYRYIWRKDSSGIEMGSGGVFREIVPPDRIVCTEAFDDPWYPGESLITVDLIEQAGKTTFRTTVLYESRPARDAVLASPMEQGIAESYNMLDELLASMRATAAKS